MKRNSTLTRLAGGTALAGAFALAACGLAGAADRTYTAPTAKVDAPLAKSKGMQTLVVAGGCFWGVDAVFKHVKGVSSVTSGYSGGEKATADYETVSTGTTGHAESVDIVFDPSQVTVGQLLRVYFSVATDPTELNRQGPDHGTQYRLRDLLRQRRAEARRGGVHRAARRREDLSGSDRDAGRPAEGVLSGRELPPELPRRCIPCSRTSSSTTSRRSRR